MNIFKVKKENNLELPIKKFTKLDLGFKRFNLPQSEFVSNNLHKKDCNIIVSWATSAGKTVCAELVAENQLKNKRKVIYACPLKALAEEKILRFKKLFPDRNIEIFTGDYNDFSKRKAKAQNADIAIVTTELLDSITRNKTLTNYLLNKAGVVIIDEFHIIATNRGAAVESAIIRLPKHISLLLLSATVPNTKEVANWIISINNKDTYIHESNYRPVKINWNIVHFKNTRNIIFHKEAFNELIKLVYDITTKDDGQILIFVWTKNIGYKIEQELKAINISCCFHNASLSLDKRTNFENDFENKKIKVLVSTTTLAWGKNTSAKYVIIFGDKRGNEYVDGWDVIQMGGRAGRTGFATDGIVYWFVANKSFAEQVLKNPPEITSILTKPEKLAFHILGEIPFYGKIPIKNVVKWYSKTFAYRQIQKFECNLILNETVDILINQTKCLIFFENTMEFALSYLGRIAKRYYLSPYGVISWFKMFKALEKKFQNNISEKILDPFIAFALLFAHASTKENLYISKNEKEWLHSVKYTFDKKQYMDILNDNIHEFVTFQSYYWYLESQQALMTNSRKVYPYYKIRDFLYDIERCASACSAIAKEILKNEQLSKNILKIGLILKYGTPVSFYDLLQINGIGAIRASKLIQAGIYDLNSLLNALDDKNNKINEILPANVIKSIKEKEKHNDKKNSTGIKSNA